MATANAILFVRFRIRIVTSGTNAEKKSEQGSVEMDRKRDMRMVVDLRTRWIAGALIVLLGGSSAAVAGTASAASPDGVQKKHVIKLLMQTKRSQTAKAVSSESRAAKKRYLKKLGRNGRGVADTRAKATPSVSVNQSKVAFEKQFYRTEKGRAFLEALRRGQAKSEPRSLVVSDSD